MSIISTSRSGSQRTTTEESSSVGPNPNVRKGFPVECSCGGQVHLASVRDHNSDGRLCYVCEHIGEAGDHLQKMFDEAVRDEIRWTQTCVAGHEDRLSRVEKNTGTEHNLGVSREITKIYGMIKALREDLKALREELELLQLRCWAVNENRTATRPELTDGNHGRHPYISKSGRILIALSGVIVVFVWVMGLQHIF